MLSPCAIGFVWRLLLHLLTTLGVVGEMQKQPHANPMGWWDSRVVLVASLLPRHLECVPSFNVLRTIGISRWTHKLIDVDRTYYEPRLVNDHGHLLYMRLGTERFLMETEFTIHEHQKFDHVSLWGIQRFICCF